MAAAAGDAHPYPIYNARYRVAFPIFDADGDLVTGAAALDSEVSQNQGTFADATNEATEVATSSGMYYLDLIATELDCKSAIVIVKTSTSGAKTTPMVLYPKRLPVIRTGTAQAGAASTITLDSGASAVDSFYNGCYVNCTNDTPSNVLGQCRKIISYVGSTKVATVEAAWGTNPSSSTTFEVLLSEEACSTTAIAGTQMVDPTTAGRQNVNTTHVSNTSQTAGDIIGDTNDIQARLPAALVSGRMDASVGAMAANVLTATAIAADAITDAKVASDVTIASVTGAVGSVTGAVGSVTGAVGSVTGNVGGNVTGSVGSVTGLTNATIADAVWDEAQAGHVTAGSFGEVATEVAAILVDTAEIGAAGAGLTALATQASVNTIDGIVDSILVDTAEIGAAGAGLTNINLPNQTMDIVGNITGNLSGSVGSVAANGLSASSLAADAVAEIADGVWDEALAGHAGAGSAGEALSAAGTAGDPWTTSLPGAYGAGTAGFILGTNLDVAASTLATAANLATAAGYIDTEVAAIKAKTDNLPASPAAVGSAMTLTSAYDFAKGDVAVAEAYATDGAEFTPAQALYMIWGLLAEKNIAGTTMTIKKLDGSTSAMTFTLNDATTPTAITRAT